MNTGTIQEQLTERIAAIQHKHTRIGHEISRHKACDLAPAQRYEGQFVEARGEQSVVPISNLKFEIAPPFQGELTTGLKEVDAALCGGLRPGLHEWYGTKLEDQRSTIEARHGEKFEIRNSKFEEKNTKLPDDQMAKSKSFLRSGPGNDFVPLCVLVHLAWRAMEANPSQWVIWVGRSCFPYPAVLARDAGRDLRLLRRCLFVRAESPADRVWVADLSIRCGLSGAVIADGSGLDMAATRRLQLSARSRAAFVFLVRPPQDMDRLSAASTRWMVRMRRQQGNEPTRQRENTNPQWSLELLRCKGMQPSTSRRVWLVEWDRAANVIRIPAPVCDFLEKEARSHPPKDWRAGFATKSRRAQG